MIVKKISLFILILMVLGCSQIQPEPFQESDGHIKAASTPAPAPDIDIPDLVGQVPIVPEPGESEQAERYTVVVNEVPVKELLFALARDAKMNVDIHPDISGSVTMNAVNQTLPQILKRISNQVELRYHYDNDNLIISENIPYLHTYKIDYVNVSRGLSSTSSISTQISSASGGGTSTSSGGGNNSTTDISSESNHRFWSRLVANISAILGESTTVTTGSDVVGTENVIPNPEVGLLTVMATAALHEQIQAFIDQVITSAKRQVLIQVTIVEVTLNEDYQAGIDWSYLNAGGIQVLSRALAGVPITGTTSSFVLQTNDDNSPARRNNLTFNITLLDEFGDARILSSPQVMVLNNQTALLKVVENVVYFEVEARTTATQGVSTTTVDTTPQTVSVGISMAVTPQIDNSGVITLNVRPTISRLNGFVTDPNPNAQFTSGTTQVTNRIPQIAVREMESVLRMNHGQIGVLGGLMTDSRIDNDAGLPGVKDIELLGNLFKATSAEYAKTELVIFIKPMIIDNPDIDGELDGYKKYLTEDYQPLTHNVQH